MPHLSRAIRARRAAITTLAAPGTSQLPPSTRFTKQDVANLQKVVVGSVVAPWTPGYDKDRLLDNPAFQPNPVLIVYCQVFADVWQCLAFAHRFDVHVVCRSGGHSTAGFSSETGAMVVDVSRLSYVAVNWLDRTARVGSGTTLGTLNGVLDGYRLHTPGGSCPDVGVAGHMMGGGYGWTSREFGMNCDNVLEVLVMLADGRTVRANATLNSDLYWAVCGGTGNNFGVLLEITYRLHDLWKIWGFGFSYPLAKAPEALYVLQHDYMWNAPPQWGAQVGLITNNGEKRLVVRGTFHGPEDAGRKLVAPLLTLAGATPEIDKVDTYASLDEWLFNEPYAYPDAPDSAPEDKLSAYCDRLLDKADWTLMAEAAGRDATGLAFLNLEVYGGAINARPVTSNAFVHRGAYFDWVQDIFWTSDAQRVVAETFLADVTKAWAPYLNGHSNQDYPRRSQLDYRWSFFGSAFNTLLWIKQKYDPTNFFRYAQSIAPYPKGETPRDTSRVLFADPGIVEEPWSQKITG